MKTETTSKEARLEFFRELYERARLAHREADDGYERNLEQYRGSKKIDGSPEEALTVRNVTYEIIESQVSSEIPMPKVDPEAYSEIRDRNAHSIEMLCTAIRDKLPFEEMNDVDERNTYVFGGGVWLVEWDNALIRGGEVGGVRVHTVSPRDFIPEPCVCSIEDMEYCFIRTRRTRGDVSRKYAVDEGELSLLECESSYSEKDSPDDTVAVTVCFYRGEDGEVGRFIFSGEVTLSDMPAYYRRRLEKCERCGRPVAECLCDECHPSVEEIEREEVHLSAKRIGEIFGGEGRRDARVSVPYYLPRSFPIVIRKNVSLDGELFGQSDCEYVRPEQQAINKIESRILQKLLRAGITPIIPEDATIALNNTVFGQVIKMKPGESADMYGKVDTTPDISQDIAEAERLYDHTKRVMGISDAFQGIDNAAGESGYAKQLRISQAQGRLESKRRMKKAAYAALYRLIFEHYLAFADEPRQLYYKDVLGNVHVEEFNRHDFLIFDGRRGELVYDDGYLFTSDSSGEEYQREALWERNLENLRSGSLGDPALPATLLRYWQSQERAHYPYARENVEYFRAVISDEIKNGKEQI